LEAVDDPTQINYNNIIFKEIKFCEADAPRKTQGAYKTYVTGVFRKQMPAEFDLLHF
jgi:hypothetical protein